MPDDYPLGEAAEERTLWHQRQLARVASFLVANPPVLTSETPLTLQKGDEMGLRQKVDALGKTIEGWVGDIRNDLATIIKSLTDVQSLLDKDDDAPAAAKPEDSDPA